MPEDKPPEAGTVRLHVIRTKRDKAGEVCIEYRQVRVRLVDDLYRPVWDDAQDNDDWAWAFGSASVPVSKWRLGYSRYYHADLPTLVENFLESRKESVEAANAALVGAKQQLHAAERFIQEVING